MKGTRVSLASGEHFYVNALPPAVIELLRSGAWIQFPGRAVNSMQVAQLYADEIPSIETPETLGD